jgi:cytoskeleton protein RodZ
MELDRVVWLMDNPLVKESEALKLAARPGGLATNRLKMGSFGEDLRKERVSRGIALEYITAVTKINQHHLLALEQEHFRQLPGGILNKGIVRGYASAVGLDQEDWTQRFLRAYAASGQEIDDDRNWTQFASNVGKARLLRHESQEMRVRWVGAILLLAAVSAGTFLAVRYYGLRAGWWTEFLPFTHAPAQRAPSQSVPSQSDQVQPTDGVNQPS